jgi:hypothetical protein
MLFNLLLWWASEQIGSSYLTVAAPSWVRRLAISLSMLYATWAGAYAIFGSSIFFYRSEPSNQSVIWIVLAIALAGTSLLAYRRRRDILPLTAVAGCVIVLGAFAIGKYLRSDDLGVFFWLALWLVVSSTLVGRWLTSLQRTWRSHTQSESARSESP